MRETPIAMRKHVAIIGAANAGKSSLFNAILNQDVAIVSEQRGTTTDPVSKTMELIPFGPITLIDTAGIDDDGLLGQKRVEKTLSMLDRVDLCLYVTDITSFKEELHRSVIEILNRKKISHLLVFTKSCSASNSKLQEMRQRFPNALYADISSKSSIESVKAAVIRELSNLEPHPENLIAGLLQKGSTVVAVIPIDSEAPKGRLIQPQVQFLRDCLNIGIQCLVTREDGLDEALSVLKSVDLVVTDSQVFQYVSERLPKDIHLTSFSILMSRLKGDFDTWVEGIKGVDLLCNGDIVLIAEGCTHNTSHEDIGHVKIPRLLQQKTGKKLNFEFVSGYDFPRDLSKYSLIVHCGGCMLNSREVESRMEKCRLSGKHITNYGVLMSYASGILDRCVDLFKTKNRSVDL